MLGATVRVRETPITCTFHLHLYAILNIRLTPLCQNV